MEFEVVLARGGRRWEGRLTPWQKERQMDMFCLAGKVVHARGGRRWKGRLTPWQEGGGGGGGG